MENRKKKTQAPISLPSMHAVQLEKDPEKDPEVSTNTQNQL